MQASLVIDGGILAGGLATRMQGQNKAMVAWVCQALSPHVRKVIINCNRNTDLYRQFSPYVCSDTINGFPGPLAGLVSLIEYSDADYFLVSPCDTPLLTQKYAQIMLAFLDQQLQLDQKQPQLFAVRSGDKQQPLHLCISRAYKSSLEAYLSRGEHRVMEWMFENQAKWVDFTTQSVLFKNFNRLEDLSADETAS